jgi:hypothetical protein
VEVKKRINIYGQRCFCEVRKAKKSILAIVIKKLQKEIDIFIIELLERN